MVSPGGSPHHTESAPAAPFRRIVHARSLDASEDRIEVVDPEPVVVQPHLEDPCRLTGGVAGELLVEHDEARTRIVVPPQVDGTPLRRGLAVTLRHLLDRVQRDVQAHHVAPERQRHVHVTDTDGDVRERADAHAATLPAGGDRSGALRDGGGLWRGSRADAGGAWSPAAGTVAVTERRHDARGARSPGLSLAGGTHGEPDRARLRGLDQQRHARRSSAQIRTDRDVPGGPGSVGHFSTTRRRAAGPSRDPIVT